MRFSMKGLGFTCWGAGCFALFIHGGPDPVMVNCSESDCFYLMASKIHTKQIQKDNCTRMEPVLNAADIGEKQKPK